MYDYLIVGAGLFGATCARLLTDAGRKVLVVDKNDHVAGNIYTKEINGIQCHVFGAHIFHTNNDTVWEFINQFCNMNNFINSPIANYNGELYSLPFNMYTFNKMWDVVSPDEAKQKINESLADLIVDTSTLEGHAISMVGTDIYNKLVKGYTEKQWGRKCSELPANIIKRLPLRFTYDNNYFNSKYQGIPDEGYTKLIENMLTGIDIKLNCDYLENKDSLNSIASKILYTGPIDEYYDFCFGKLEYRSVKFETEILSDCSNFQGNAVVNYTDNNTPYTRIIEHKWFNKEKYQDLNYTIISREYSLEHTPGMTPCYPIQTDSNTNIYNKYVKKSLMDSSIIFGGRLGSYKYMDMDVTVLNAMELISKLGEYNGLYC